MELQGEFCPDEIGPDNKEYISTSYVHFNNTKYVAFCYLNGDKMCEENYKIDYFFNNSDNILIKKDVPKKM